MRDPFDLNHIDLTKPNTYPPLQILLDDGDEVRVRDMFQDSEYVGVDGENQPGHMSNTAPIKNLNLEGRETGGYDTLEILVHGEWDINKWDTLRGEMQEGQVAAREAGEAIAEYQGDPVKVWASGVRRGLYCTWVLEWKGMRFSIVNQRKSSKSRYGVHVAIGSLACMELGGEKAWELAKGFLSALGLRIEGNVLSRCDVCVDMPEVDMHTLTLDYVARKCVMRAKNGQVYEEGRLYTGFRRGSSRRIMLRVYDKLRELGASKEDSFKEKILVENRWGGLPTNAVRVEFQLRREAIKDFAIDSFEDFCARAGEVCGWLSKEWFRMCSHVPVKGHSQDADTSELWCEVQEAFVTAFGEAKPPRRPRKEPLRVMPEALKRQAVGCITSVLACTGELPKTGVAFLQAAMRLLADGADLWSQEVLDKRASLETWAASLVGADVSARGAVSIDWRQQSAAHLVTIGAI